MIFPIAEFEEVVQVDDLTRISAAKSAVTPDEDDITLVEIKPSASDDYYTVSGADVDQDDWFLDWVYSAAGSKTITVRITCGTGGEAVVTTKTFTTTAVTSAVDKLFSSDEDLKTHEPDVMKWVKPGRATFKDIHRRAQTTILQVINREGIFDTNRARLTKDAVVDTEELREWSAYLALALIWEGRKNSVDDVFSEKAKHYRGQAAYAKNRAFIALDLNGDGRADPGEDVAHDHVTVVRV